MSSERTPAYAGEHQKEDIFLRPWLLHTRPDSSWAVESVSWTVSEIVRETRPARDNIQLAIWGILTFSEREAN
jgi:hypothetical protein